MLQITGKVINVFTQDGGKNKDGTEYEERHKVQLMGGSIAEWRCKNGFNGFNNSRFGRLER